MNEQPRDESAEEVEYLYLTVENILDLFADYFPCSSADGADQVRNKDGLASAVDRSRTYAHYQSADIALQAAVLAHGIAKGQVFVDGNKTIALLAMLIFLDINGLILSGSDDTELAQWILELSGNRPSKAWLTMYGCSLTMHRDCVSDTPHSCCPQPHVLWHDYRETKIPRRFSDTEARLGALL
jgi:death-on-curing protein